MKILSALQLHQADAYTIEQKSITSIDLMENAAELVFNHLKKEKWYPHQESFCIFCGKGNNGGDGLALTRMLIQDNKTVQVIILHYSTKASSDFLTNYERIQNDNNSLLKILEISDYQDIAINPNAIIIDAIFGSGLNKPLDGMVAQYVSKCNSLPNKKIAIDIPSGMFADRPCKKKSIVFQADETLTFYSPKLQFLFAENEQYTGSIFILNLDLKIPNFTNDIDIEYVEQKDIILKKRGQFSHKGTFGHALLVAGSYGKMGAAILASRACLRSGCGLLTTHVPQCGYQIMQISIPEAMVSVDSNNSFTTQIPIDTKYSAIGIGPGFGTDETSAKTLEKFLKQNDKPLVLDADALTILSQHQELWQWIKPNTILTPHPGEFDRLTHKHTTSYERFCTLITFAKEHNCIVVLKGHYTTTIQKSKIFVNSTGCAAMATAGSGDVLTGIILSLLAQGYSCLNAAKYGVFLHGKAGTTASINNSRDSLLASDIITEIGKN